MKKITLIMLIAIAAMSAKAYTYYDGIEIGNFRYNLALATSSSEESKATLQGLSSAGASATSLKIAGYVTYDGNRYRVASIATNAFQYKTSVTSVELGYGVQKIGNNAFKGCESLSSILLPSSITEIGTYAFQNCTALVFVRVAGDVAPAIQDNTFNNSSTTKRVSTATYRGMNALKADSKWVAAFGASNIKRHNGIATYDFISGNLYYVIKNGLPYNGTSSDPSKRSSCVIVGANLSSNTTVTINSSVSNTDNNAPGSYRVYGVADSAFMNNSAVTEVKCNYNQASRIGESAFRNCTGLTSAEVTADTVGNYAFYACSNLTSAALNKDGVGGVEYLDSYAFGECALTTATIPKTTRYIGSAPFCNNNTMTSIMVDADNTYFSSYNDALYDKSLTTLYQIPGNWSYDSNTSQNGPFPETLQTVKEWAGAFCPALTTLHLNYGVKTIENFAFAGCTNLTTVRLPSSLSPGSGVTVRTDAFTSCSAVKTVYMNFSSVPTFDYFPAVTDKSKVALYTPLESMLDFHNSSIYSKYNHKTGDYDHQNCFDIYFEQLYYTVISTSPYSHNGYSGSGTLEVVRIPMGGTREIPTSLLYGGKRYVPTTIGNHALNITIDNQTIITDAPSITHINTAAFENSKLASFAFPNVEIIGNSSFYNCKKLEVDLGGSNKPLSRLREIRYEAFKGSAIKSFTATTNLEEIGSEAFYNCSNLKEIFLPHIEYINDIECGTNFFGNNASGFKCWVDYRRLGDFLNTDKWDWSYIYPHLYLDSEWQSFACVNGIQFKDTGVQAYTVSNYNQYDKKATLTSITNVEKDKGCVVHGNVGTYYRLKYASAGDASSWLVGVTSSAQTVNSDNTTSYFKLNATKPVFNKVTTSTAFERGYAYLKVPTSQTGGATTIITNLSGSIADVNGDGKVNVSDVTALINMILGMTTMDEARADVNGDTRVNVSDVTALINIILGIS